MQSFNNFSVKSQYRRARNDNSDDTKYVIRILVSFFIIILSVAAVYVVILRVTDIKILEKINLKPEVHDSVKITSDPNTGTSLFITDEKGLKFRKEDKSFAREEWIEKNGELFYFDTAGYGLNGDLKKDGQVYTFENGKLINIKRDTSYVKRAKDNLYSSVESAQYLVWLVDDEKDKSFYPIKYKQYSDDTEDYLGTEIDKQYASPNMVKINMSNIYYLAVGKGTDYAGRLYRMRPNAIHKETIGIGVTGFIVLSDEVVYYCDGDRVMKAKSWRGVEIKLPDDEEINDEGEIVHKVATKSNVDIDIINLPIPDAKVEITNETTVKESIDIDKIETTKKETEKETDKVVVQVGVGPEEIATESTKPSKVTEVEVGVAPKIIEVESPR